jgi:hypothetical protein
MYRIRFIENRYTKNHEAVDNNDKGSRKKENNYSSEIYPTNQQYVRGRDDIWITY